MSRITYNKLHKAIKDGKIEVVMDLRASGTSHYAQIRMTKTGNRKMVEVYGTPTEQEKNLFKI
jgi:hypothetical protein